VTVVELVPPLLVLLPAVAMLLGAIVLSEPLTIGMAVGFPLVLIGSYLGTTRAAPAAAPATQTSR